MTDEKFNEKERRRLAEELVRKKLTVRLEMWRGEGYYVDDLQRLLDESSIDGCKLAVKEFGDKVARLKDLELEILLFHPEGFEEEIEGLKSKLKDVRNLADIEREYTHLKMVIGKVDGKVSEGQNLPSYWEMKDRIAKMYRSGYEVKRLEDMLDKPGGILECSKVIDQYEKNIQVIDKIKATVMDVKMMGLDNEVTTLKDLMKDPARMDDIKKALMAYKAKLGTLKKEIAIAERKSVPITTPVASSAPVPAIPKAEVAEKAPPPVKPVEAPKDQVKQFRRIDLYIELMQAVFQENKRLLTLDTLRLTQRMLKRKQPKIMFFVIDKDFKINSMMPDSPDSINALNVFMTHIFESLIPIIGLDQVVARMRSPVRTFIAGNMERMKASGLMAMIPDFLNPDVDFKMEYEIGEGRGEEGDRRLPSPVAVPLTDEEAKAEVAAAAAVTAAAAASRPTPTPQPAAPPTLSPPVQKKKKFKIPKVKMVAEVSEESKLDMEQIKAKVHEWEAAGYNVEMLQRVMDQDEKLVFAVYRKLDEEIFWMNEMSKDLDTLEKKGFTKEVAEIRKKLKDPALSREVEDDIMSLQMHEEMGN